MKRICSAGAISIVALAFLLFSTGSARAEETVVDQVLAACEADIDTYCSQVTPGEGRLLACFMAHEDKISGQCSWALYKGMQELEAFVTAVAYLAESCWDDLAEYCADVEMGEGRVATCLLENEEKVAPACRQAIEDVELEVIED